MTHSGWGQEALFWSCIGGEKIYCSLRRQRRAATMARRAAYSGLANKRKHAHTLCVLLSTRDRQRQSVTVFVRYQLYLSEDWWETLSKPPLCRKGLRWHISQSGVQRQLHASGEEQRLRLVLPGGSQPGGQGRSLSGVPLLRNGLGQSPPESC